jgi:hypothetical protein
MINEISIAYPTQVSAEARPRAVLDFAKAIKGMGDKAKIMLATAWFEIRKEEYWRELSKADGSGFASFDEYIHSEFGYGKSTSAALIGVYETYVVNLGYQPEDIADVPWFHLRALVPVINRENAADYLEKARGMTQKEITQWVKELRGTPETKERQKKFSVPLTPLQTEVCDQAMTIAKEATGSEIPGLQLEYICADFVCGNDLKEASRVISLKEWISRIERMFGVKLAVIEDTSDAPNGGEETVSLDAGLAMGAVSEGIGNSGDDFSDENL